MESLIAYGEKIISSEAATGGLEIVGKNANESGSKRAGTKSEVHSCVYDIIEIRGMEVEARICSLEK